MSKRKPSPTPIIWTAVRKTGIQKPRNQPHWRVTKRISKGSRIVLFLLGGFFMFGAVLVLILETRIGVWPVLPISASLVFIAYLFFCPLLLAAREAREIPLQEEPAEGDEKKLPRRRKDYGRK